MSIWLQVPTISHITIPSPEESATYYLRQIDHLSNAILIDDYNPDMNVDIHQFKFATKYKWINKGELISGSYATLTLTAAVNGGIGTGFKADDVDIYFKSMEDAKEFSILNNFIYADFSHPMCAYVINDGMRFNLIFGIKYDSPQHLISKFDIRACSIAIDPNADLAYAVAGALHDALHKDIVYNPVPRAVSVRRLVKYIEKGFKIDKNQRLFFAELVRSNLYSPELEANTAY